MTRNFIKRKSTKFLITFLLTFLIENQISWADTVTSESQLIVAANTDSPGVIDLGSNITMHGQLAPTFSGTLNGNNYTITLAPTEADPASTVAAPLFGTLSSGSTINGLNLALDGAATDGVLGQGMLANSVGPDASILNVQAQGRISTEFDATPAGGLVGTNEGKIENSVANVVVSGGTRVGGLVGSNSSSGEIKNSLSFGNVAGNNKVGGIAGDNSGTILNSSSQGVVTGSGTGTDSVGGLLGTNNSSGIVSNSFSNATILSYGDNIGGLVGQNIGQIKNSISSGSASSTSPNGSNLGGLVGLNWGQISNSKSQGEVAAGWSNLGSGAGNSAGGLVGTNKSGGTIYSSISLSNISSNEGFYIGGLVGNNEGNISNSFSGGKVDATSGSSAGGLVGQNLGEIQDSLSKSSVIAKWTIGGLAGINSGIINTSVASVGTVTGGSEVGGLVGYNYGEIRNSLAYGDVLPTETEYTDLTKIGTLIGLQEPGKGITSFSRAFGHIGEFNWQIGNNRDWAADDPEGSVGTHLTFDSDRELLNTELSEVAWANEVGINTGNPYLLNFLGKNIYSEPIPVIYLSYKRSKIQEVINEPVTFSEKLEVHKIKEFLSGAITKPTPADFKNLGILGVNPLNLPILLKLLKDLNISDLTPEIIKEQLRIANSILSKQLKAKQKAKAKK